MSQLSEKTSFLKMVFGQGDLSRDGTNITVKCPSPMCQSRVTGKKKFSVRIDTDQSHCWVCGMKTHDSLIPVLRKYFSSDLVKEYVEKYQAHPSSNVYNDDQTPEHHLDFPHDFTPLAPLLGTRDYEVTTAVKYLLSRGLTERDMWYFKLGISKMPKFRKRIIVPSFDSDGVINFYSARSASKDVKGPKYMVPNTERVSVIFNEVNIDWKSELTIVEGPFDLFKCDDNATCLQGSGLSEDYLLFWKIVTNKTPIILALDADAQSKAHRIAKILSAFDIQVKMLHLNTFADVGEMKRSDFLRLKQEASPWTRNDSILNKIAHMKSISPEVLLRQDVMNNRKNQTNA